MTRLKRIVAIGLSSIAVISICSAGGGAQSTPKPDAAAAARFLQQASWGPTAATIAHVQDVGFDGYINEQFLVPASPLDVPQPSANGSIPFRPVQDQFFFNAVNGQDQLRQRVAFALSEIWVVSGVKITDPRAMVNYLQVLEQDAFANYYDVMRDVTLCPAMGHYLDMVNNDKPDPRTGKSADENYAREIMQLFTIGLSVLSPDGTPVMGKDGNPVPTYTQDTIEGFSRAFTGWTYAPAAGATPHAHNPANWTQPMVPWEANHDTQAKTLLSGEQLPTGQTAEQDLKGALDNIFYHPNVGPFICRQLIQHLVTSSPSPGYVQRIVNVFNGAFAVPRGDMKAVVKAILLDPEARAGDDAAPATDEGHLREPVLFINGLLRALSATVGAANGLAPEGANLGQNIYFPPTVFSYFAPGYEIPGTAINAPEFQILSTSTAMLRADFVNDLVYGKIAGVTIDFNPWIQLATNSTKSLDTSTLLDLLNAALMGGRMPADMRSVIQKAVDAASSPKAKVQTAIYLIATSSQYQIER
jgi:uncharacterized protein (DUF1800 family)